MEKRISSRAVITDNDSLLTIFRRKIKEGKKEEYYVLPGGGLEGNETPEENVTRELKEELTIDIEILGYLGTIETEDRLEHYFHCKIVSGTPTIGGEELDRMSNENYYEVRTIPLQDLDTIDVKGKDKIQKALSKEYEE